jgi:MtN3 and saliva related transmembrane protein
MEDWAISLLGLVAGLCTTGSFVPQVVKAWRDGETSAISTRMYVIISVAFVLWLGYGAIIGSWPMIVFNLLNLALGGAILALKLRDIRRQRSGGASPVRTDTARPGPQEAGTASSNAG